MLCGVFQILLKEWDRRIPWLMGVKNFDLQKERPLTVIFFQPGNAALHGLLCNRVTIAQPAAAIGEILIEEFGQRIVGESE